MFDLNLAENMRREGATYKEIANHFGITKQAVHISMKNHGVIRRRYESIFESCPYKGLGRFLAESKNVTLTDLCCAIFGTSERKSREKTRRLLEGDNILLTINAIKRLENFTAMSFDELFCEKEDT